MLAETRGTGPVGPGPPWRPSTSAKNLGTCQRQQGGKYRRQASGQKSCFFGLETRPELVWEDWDHGREFTKTLVLKNIHSKLQKLNIRPPVSTVFSVTSPETIVLSQGTSFLLPVTFRPLQKCEYEDSIEFQCKEGSFQVCLRAIVPCHALEVPDSVMLPLCAVQHSTHTTFLLRNSSKLQTCFQWECAAPFQLSPEQGLLKPGNECHITVVFQPQEAQLYQQQVYCRFGEEVDKAVGYCTVLLQALAKYPYLQLRNPSIKEGEEHSDPVLCFGCVAIGKSLQKHFDIINPSPVTASFSLSQLSNGIPLCGSEFTCDISRGKVAPGGMVHATVTYSPAAVDTVSVEYLSLKYKGALNETLLKLTGKCIGPTVSLSSSVLDFGCVEEGGSIVQTVELVNSSPVEACYQWDIDCCGNSVFHILPASGTVLPHSHATLKAVYRPMHPMAHYRRVPCLILYRDPVFLDLIGTCHSELQQPAILKPEHLVEYKLHWHHREHSPDTMSGMQQDHIAMNQQESPTPLDESNPRVDSAPVLSTTPMGELYQTSLGCMDPLSSQRSSLSSLHVSVEPNELLFNHKMTSSLCTSSVSSQSVSLKNHTGGKLSLVWTVAQDSPFSISPSSCHLAPLKSTSFRVTYSPKQLNTLHGAQLECFAYYKQGSQGIGEQVPYPPRCVTVRVIGHSFQPGKEHFIPSCTLKPPQVVFPALSVISYQTVLLQNNGDLPLTFFLDHSSKVGLAESVFIVPSCGLIQPGRHQILTLRTIPTEDCPKQGFNLCLQLNAAKLTKELTVLCVVEKPRVSLEGGCTLYFQTTAVGSQSQRAHRIRNFSRLPVRFKWSIPELDQELIFVEPDAGELHPNESSVQTWSFIPLAEKTYTVKPTLTFWPSQTDGSNKSHIGLKVVGKGSIGTIEAERAVLDVGEALIGSNRSIEIPLVNNSPCPVSFCLSVKQDILDGELSNDPKAESSALQLDCMRATIASNSTMKLQSTVKPQRRTQYLWTISYQTLNANGSVSSSPQALCEVRVKGVFPTLQVMDACGGGSVGRLSKVHLWKLFSLHRLNEFLLSSPSPAELTFRTPTRHSLRSCPSVFTKAVLDFNFSLAPLNSDPSNIVLMFHNPGSVPVDWAFLFPADQQIELEYWTETGEFTSTDLYQMKVQENQLFSVSPRSGTLLPGQKRAVHFSYRHDFAGTDRFPVVFKLSHGREILLSLQGLTVERDRPYLHFASYQHVFTSVTIGDCNPPRQVYKLHNGGAVPVHYEVDTGVLSQLHEDNFNHPVLCCLSPVGEVLPGKTAMLEWIFSPLEAKTYHVDVPIHIQDGDTTLVKFKGCGIDTPTLGFLNTQSDSKVSGPCDQKVPFPGQVLFLSEDSVCLGDIPVCSRSSRILFLTNVSYTHTVHYTWDLPQPGNQQVVQIHPEGGHVRPGECVLCVLTFSSTDYPTIYQLDLVCQVTREAALTLYRDTLQRWEEERDAQQDELMVRDKNVTQSQRVLIDKEPLATPTRKGPPLRKYKTLPPICASSSCETVGSICTKLTRAERRAQRATTRVRKRPVPPQPALLHLEVTAHSHGRQEYLTHFPDQFNRHYRYLQSVKTQPPQTTCSSASFDRDWLPTPTRGPKKDILVHIFASMLRDILDDSAFVQSLVTVASKPIIYRPRETPSQPPSLPKSSSSPTPCVPADMSEYVLMNTLQNLMMEAVRGELVLTSHPRTIILPPVSTRSRRTSNVMAREEKP